jgi:hypothetical protein
MQQILFVHGILHRHLMRLIAGMLLLQHGCKGLGPTVNIAALYLRSHHQISSIDTENEKLCTRDGREGESLIGRPFSMHGLVCDLRLERSQYRNIEHTRAKIAPLINKV